MADNPTLASFSIADLSDDAPMEVEIEGKNAIVVRHGGKVCVVGGTCPHLGAPLKDGLVVDGEIRCPWHHARFSLETGEAVGAPAFDPITSYEAVEEAGVVRVVAKRDSAKVDAEGASNADLGRVVVIGAGGAGYAFAELLTRRGAGGSLTVLSEDDDAPYDRTFCSKQYLSGDKARADAALPALGGANVRTGLRVAAIDAAANEVELAGGERLGFDFLVLALGAEAAVPDFTGADRPDAYTLRSMADADALIAAAEQGKRAVIVGASYIGLEVAAALTKRGLTVEVAGRGEQPLEGTAGVEIGKAVRALHEDKGVTFHMGCEITAWDGETATLDNGDTVPADFLVLGTGAKPRLDLAKAAGLTIADKDAGGGVLVDASLRTSQPNIFAIGDIASVPDPRLGHPIRVEHWVVAQRMGQWLARHLLGETDAEYGEVPFFWSGHYDANLRYVGHVASPDDRRIEGDVSEHDVAVHYREEDKEQALLTWGRDLAALKAEAEWNR